MITEIQDYYGDVSKVTTEPGNSVRIETESQGKFWDVSFVMGGEAVYDSYNLVYTGTIVKITNKTVTVAPKWGEKNTRMSLAKFARKNYRFDAEKIAARNAETMMAI